MTVVRADVAPQMLRWARERARLERDALSRAFPKLPEWERGTAKPTFKQLEAFAKRTHAPLGYFFLAEPPAERLPIPDFRTVGSTALGRPSPELLDAIYLCQRQQGWYREYAEANGEEALAFVGSLSPNGDVVSAANAVRSTLQLDLRARQSVRTWEEALRQLVTQTEALGVLVMRNGIVGNNTHRVLDVEEFRGFALVDRLAPLIFINAADSKSAQMFTLVHELVHIFSGREGLSDATPRNVSTDGLERWCNEVAAEVLVPLAEFASEYRSDAELESELQRLARVFKVSTLVLLRRVFDSGALPLREFTHAYAAEVARLKAILSERSAEQASGGDFHRTAAVRVGRRFATSLVRSTLEGRTLYRDAFRLLGIRKSETFREFSLSLGEAV